MCPAQITNNPIKCIFTEYTDETVSKVDLRDQNGALLPWGKYMSDEQMKVTFQVNGNNTAFNKGGYMLRIGSDDLPFEQVKANIGNMSNFITENTLAFNFVISGYILDVDYFYSINLLVEKTSTGSF